MRRRITTTDYDVLGPQRGARWKEVKKHPHLIFNTASLPVSSVNQTHKLNYIVLPTKSKKYLTFQMMKSCSLSKGRIQMTLIYQGKNSDYQSMIK
jgi:hypothetical protein